MNFWLSELIIFEDTAPHSAPLNMAIDEALLAIAPSPILRIYQWRQPAVSFGYFERWEPIRAAHAAQEPVRRWTGGGIVLHGQDSTYSLLVPRSSQQAPLSASGSYGVIHQALCRALAEVGITANPATASQPKLSQACFENPVLHDVLVKGRKVAGAAQRRTRQGLIHQGSIQDLRLPRPFWSALAAQLTSSVREDQFDVIQAAEILAFGKYGTRQWLERFP